MAQLVTEIPDADFVDVRDTLARVWKYPTTIDDGNGNQIPNPQSKAQFLKAYVAKFIKDAYKFGKAQELDQDIQDARNLADQVAIQ